VKSFLRLAMLILVLLTVALVSALTAMRFAIHGREVVVPKLVGMTPAEADRTAQANGLQLDIERQYYSPNIPEGRVMSQVPAPGTKVRHGWQVRVAQSLGPQRIAIPDVTGQTARAAAINIQRRGLEAGATATIKLPSSPVEQVLAQSPPANASGVSTPRISLLVAGSADAQAFVMPNLVGQTLSTVTQLLQQAGMHVGSVTVAGAAQSSAAANSQTGSSPPLTSTVAPLVPTPDSLVLSHNPAAGQKITAGSAVNLEVSK
jgi:eukaryotic-like serine/threonine-protein kinase